MCNSFIPVKPWVIALFALIVFSMTAGCGVPKHSNTLIFGTNTKFALDVSVDTTGSPDITFGYKRQEAVWMPLLANQNKENVPASCTTGDCLFIGKENSNISDTYSVLASFGAHFSTIATAEGAPQTNAAVGLAQYFATGLAARKLAEIGGAQLVSVQPTETVNEEIKKAAAEQLKQWDYKADLITTYVQEDGKVKADRLDKLTRGTGLESTFKSKFAGKDITLFKRAITGTGQYVGNVDALAKNIK